MTYVQMSLPGVPGSLPGRADIDVPAFPSGMWLPTDRRVLQIAAVAVAAPGWFKFFKCGQDYAYKIWSLYLGCNPAEFTFTILEVTDGQPAAANRTIIDYPAASESVKVLRFAQPLVLLSQEELWLYVDAFIGAGSFAGDMRCQEYALKRS